MAKLLTEIGPNDAEAWYFLGCLNGVLGEFDEAKNNLFRSLESDGDKFSELHPAFRCLHEARRLKESTQWGYRALECNPENVSIYHKLADLHVLEGNTMKGVKLLESFLEGKSISIKNRYATLVRLGHLCMLTQRMKKKACNHFEAAQKLNPSDESLWTDIGHCLSRLGDTEDALSVFKKAAHSNPSPRNIYNLGDAYLTMDDPERSIAPLVEATRMDPGFSLAHYDLEFGICKDEKVW